MENLDELKNAWNESKRDIISYFDEKGIKVFDKDGFGYAYDKNTGKLICACDLSDDDIVEQISMLRPEVKTEELDVLSNNLDKCYAEYTRQYIAENY